MSNFNPMHAYLNQMEAGKRLPAAEFSHSESVNEEDWFGRPAVILAT